MTEIYSVDIQIGATAYVKAGSQAEAETLLKTLTGKLVVSGEAISHGDGDHAPNTAVISDTMTVHGVWPGETLTRV